jgi:hypothetical protein
LVRQLEQAPEKARRYWQQSKDIAAYASSRNERSSDWQQQPGTGAEVTVRDLGLDFSKAPQPPANPDDRQRSIDLDRRTLQHSNQAPYATVMPEGWKASLGDPSIQAAVSTQPRSVAPPVGDTVTAANVRTAIEARGVGRGEAFRDDQNLRDAIAVSSGYIAQGRKNNAAASNATWAQARAGEVVSTPEGLDGIGGSQGLPLQSAPPRQAADVLQLDAGTLGGVGRRGSTFEQAPIAAAPISSVPQAAQDQLNTLRSSLERPVTAAYSTQELDDARARHIMSYIQSAATPSFDKAGRQTSGWTGGDSHHGGARLAGRADRNVGAYNAPSEAMLSALALAARRRTGAL